jgi:DNA polymerase-4
MLIYVHVPGFYAAVEQADHLEHQGRPIVVGRDPSKGGSVTSASREARSAGIVEGMTHSQAVALAPDVVWLPTRQQRYREVAAGIRSVLRGITERVEPAGLDGAYLEPPPGEEPVNLAAGICVRLQAELGVAAVAGLGPTRFVAWLAARNSGPAGIRAVATEDARAFLGSFPVTEVWGLGPATAEKLAEQGITRVSELQDRSLAELEDLVGRPATRFRALVLCQDLEPLRASPPVKSVSRETTLEEPNADLRALGEVLTELSRRLDEMLSRERRVGRTVSLGLGYTDGERVTRTLTVPDPVAGHAEIGELALRLLSRIPPGQRLVRRLRLRVTNLSDAPGGTEPRQLRLF